MLNKNVSTFLFIIIIDSNDACPQKLLYYCCISTNCVERLVYPATICTNWGERLVYPATICTNCGERLVYPATICTNWGERLVYPATICATDYNNDVHFHEIYINDIILNIYQQIWLRMILMILIQILIIMH